MIPCLKKIADPGAGMGFVGSKRASKQMDKFLCLPYRFPTNLFT
jgi:hypothetical protein